MKFKTMGSPEDDSLSEINIIPLVDIMLVLLIIFMVTAPMMNDGIDIHLPEVSAGSIASKTDDFVLSIDQDGRIYLNNNPKEKYSLVSIEDKIKEMFVDKEQKSAVYLRADESIKYSYVIEVMAILQRNGIQKIGLVTTPDETKPQ